MASLATPVLIVIFVACAVAIWVAGIRLSSSTGALDTRLGLGSALGGLLLLALATDLPELAITITAAAHNNLGLAIGNLLGGIAIQTVVLTVLDVGTGRERPLTYMVGSLLLVIEGALVGVVTVMAMMTTQLPASTELLGVSPGTIAIVVIWVAGLKLVARSRERLPWKIEAVGAQPGRSHAQRRSQDPKPHREHSTKVVALIFAAAAAVTLVAGGFVGSSRGELARRARVGGPGFRGPRLAGGAAPPGARPGPAGG